MDKKVEEMGLHAAGVHVGPLDSRPARLFVALASFLAVNAMIAEFVGVKIFALEPSLGVAPFNWNLFGQNGSLSFTSGVLLWPFVFLMTDVINEYFGRRGVQFISWLTVVLISYGFLTAYLAIALTPAGWWVTVNQRSGVPNMQAVYTKLWNDDRLAGQVDARGVQNTPKIGRDAKWQLTLLDPDGTRAEVMELHAIGKPCCSPFTASDPEK